MTRMQALSVAQYAVNTLLQPDASQDEGFAVFFDHAEDALRVSRRMAHKRVEVPEGLDLHAEM